MVDGGRTGLTGTYAGRTGRFGRKGISINFVHDKATWQQMEQIERQTGKQIIRIETDDLDAMEEVRPFSFLFFLPSSLLPLLSFSLPLYFAPPPILRGRRERGSICAADLVALFACAPSAFVRCPVASLPHFIFISIFIRISFFIFSSPPVMALTARRSGHTANEEGAQVSGEVNLYRIQYLPRSRIPPGGARAI